MTFYEVVREQFEFPFELRPYQIQEVNDLCEFDRAGYYWEPGSGKTAGSTHQALYWNLCHGNEQWLIVMPPILLLQWELWLKSIRHKATGKPGNQIDHRLRSRRNLSASLTHDALANGSMNGLRMANGASSQIQVGALSSWS